MAKKPTPKKLAVDPNEARFVLSVEQGSDEWKALRAGRVTASKVADAISKLKNGGESATRRELRIKLVTEALTGEPADDIFETAAIRWGRENEAYARMYYEELRQVQVRQIAFAHHPTLKRAGASPDGLVGTDGLLEIKCPMSHTHLNYILAGVVPEDYKPQMLWQMECTGRNWCDLMSFDPRMPKGLRVFIRRFQKDQVALASITTEVTGLINEVEEMVKSLNALPIEALTNN
jgi:putative phage-type endonuclease